MRDPASFSIFFLLPGGKTRVSGRWGARVNYAQGDRVKVQGFRIAVLELEHTDVWPDWHQLA